MTGKTDRFVCGEHASLTNSAAISPSREIHLSEHCLDIDFLGAAVFHRSPTTLRRSYRIGDLLQLFLCDDTAHTLLDTFNLLFPFERRPLDFLIQRCHGSPIDLYNHLSVHGTLPGKTGFLTPVWDMTPWRVPLLSPFCICDPSRIGGCPPTWLSPVRTRAFCEIDCHN